MISGSERKDAPEMPEGAFIIVKTREIIVKEIHLYCSQKLMALQGVLRVHWWGRIISPSASYSNAMVLPNACQYSAKPAVPAN